MLWGLDYDIMADRHALPRLRTLADAGAANAARRPTTDTLVAATDAAIATADSLLQLAMEEQNPGRIFMFGGPGSQLAELRRAWSPAPDSEPDRILRLFDLGDQVEACRRIFASEKRWTVVRGSDLEEGESQGLPIWRRHVGDPALARNLTSRVDFARFMVEALERDELIHEAPAIVGR